MKTIKLTQGKEAIIDDADFAWLGQWKWYFHAGRYASRKEGAKTETIRMHRLILEAKKGDICDHINGNTLDNRRGNLRVCTYAGENVVNSPPRRDNTSGYKGVTWHKRVGKWGSSLFKQGKRHHLGFFDDKREAALAYNKAAVEFFPGYAYLNQI